MDGGYIIGQDIKISCSLMVEHHSSKMIIWVRFPTRYYIYKM